MRTTRAHSAVDIQVDQELLWRGLFRWPFRSILRSSDAPRLLKSQQVVARHEQFRQSRHDEQAIAVLHHQRFLNVFIGEAGAVPVCCIDGVLSHKFHEFAYLLAMNPGKYINNITGLDSVLRYVEYP